MSVLSIQNLLLGLIVVVPGFISTHVALSFGVVRIEIAQWRLLIVSLTASIIVDTLFIGILQWQGTQVQSPADIEAVFFRPTFHPLLVFLLLAISAGIGIVGAVILAADLHEKVRNIIWNSVGNDRRRKPLEPWEDVLDNAARVQLTRTDGSVVVGELYQYSDDDKEHQIAIRPDKWNVGNGFKEIDTDIELFLADEISHISIINSQQDTPGYLDWIRNWVQEVLSRNR